MSTYETMSGWLALNTKDIPEGTLSVIDYPKFAHLFPQTSSGWRPRNLQINKEGIYSISGPRLMKDVLFIIKRQFPDLSQVIVTDATANVGGSAITLGLYCKKVQAVELIESTADILQHNIQAYNLEQCIQVYRGNYLQLLDELQQDIVFIDPPWGGVDYKMQASIMLFLSEVPLFEVIQKLLGKAQLVVIKAPNNFDRTSLDPLVTAWSITFHPSSKCLLVICQPLE